MSVKPVSGNRGLPDTDDVNAVTVTVNLTGNVMNYTITDGICEKNGVQIIKAMVAGL